MRGAWITAVLLCLSAMLGTPAHAHSASTAYLAVQRDGDGVTLQWRIALRDLDALLDLDADGDGRLRWGEVLDRSADIATLARARLPVVGVAPGYAVNFSPPQFLRLGELGFAQLDGRLSCAGARALRYALFDGLDPTHRALVQVDGGAARLLGPGEELELAASGAAPSAPRGGFVGFVREGIGHILGGFDHLLFLIALLLPAVVTRTDQGIAARSDRRAALIEVAWLATAFTVAHSLTLACATFGWLRVAPSVIEPLVALTVLAAALNNLVPVVTRRLALAAFAFGLIHGFAFAEVLAPLALPRGELALALLGFNLGVEAGQLSVVGATFALLAWAARWQGYSRWVLRAGSAGVALLAALWIIERVFDVSLIGA